MKLYITASQKVNLISQLTDLRHFVLLDSIPILPHVFRRLVLNLVQIFPTHPTNQRDSNISADVCGGCVGKLIMPKADIAWLTSDFHPYPEVKRSNATVQTINIMVSEILRKNSMTPRPNHEPAAFTFHSAEINRHTKGNTLTAPLGTPFVGV